MAGRHYSKLKDDIKKVLHRIPGIGDPMLEVAQGLEEGVRQVFTPGHAVRGARLPLRRAGQRPLRAGAARRAARSARRSTARCCVHAITQKGKGYKYAEDEPVEYHGPSPFDPVAGIQKGEVGAGALLHRGLRQDGRQARRARPADRGDHRLDARRHRPRCRSPRSFPDRFLNTGIAEQHSVTLAGGLALGGIAAGGGDLLDVPAARLRPDLPRRLPHGPAGRLRARPRRHRRQRRLDAPRPVRLRLLPHLPEHDRHGAEGRERAPAHARDRRRAAASDGGALPARQRLGVPLDAEFRPAADRQGRGAAPRPPRLGLGDRLDGLPGARGRRAAGEGGRRAHRGQRPLRQAARPRAAARRRSSSSAARGRRAARDRRGARGRRRFRRGGCSRRSPRWSSPGSRRSPIGVPDKFVPHGSQDVLRKTLGLDAESLYFRFRTFFGERAAAAPAEPAAPPARPRSLA